MIALEQARHYMETLGLTQAAAVLDSRLDAAGHIHGAGHWDADGEGAVQAGDTRCVDYSSTCRTCPTGK